MANTKKSAVNNQANRKWLWLGALGIVVILAGILFVVLNNNAGSTTQTLPAEINVEQAKAKQDAGAFVLDVREQDEWNTVHIPGATLIPLGQLPQRLAEVPKDQQVVVVCHSGNRSKKGRDILLQAGFSQVTSMAGGMNDWAAKGLPTSTGP